MLVSTLLGFSRCCYQQPFISTNMLITPDNNSRKNDKKIGEWQPLPYFEL